MKRIFSKKSGFTLVEIIVAFAVFAIMSTMILSMVDLTVKEKGKTNELVDSIDEQTGYLTYHYIDDTDKYPAAAPGTTVTPDGTFRLKFYGNAEKDGKTSEVLKSDVSMDYVMRSSVDGTENAGEGINYFVGNVDYTDPSGPLDDKPGGGDVITGIESGSQIARYDSRIFGSKNLKFIQIHQVVKDTSYNVAGQSRYFIECSAAGLSVDAAGGTVPKEDVPYLQYKLRFVSSTSYKEVDGTVGNKTYTYKIYDEVPILECGYVKNENLVWDENTCEDYRVYKPTSSDDYTVEKTSDCIIRIGIPLAYGKTAQGFQGSIKRRFYVVFDGDPGLTVDSFGSNSVGGKYELYVDSSGEYNPNIYGAFPYEKTLKAGS